jgi:hypothetical protein
MRFELFTLAATIRSLFRSPAPVPEPAPAPKAAEQRKLLYALVQTRPHVVVLAVSDSRPDLEAELGELEVTWNHFELRAARHRFEIQTVCLLQTARDPVMGVPPQAGPREMRQI